MPVYEYECQACHRDFEYQQRMSDPDKTVCESCGGALERIISRTAFQLKGSGWYKDLYSSSKPEAKASTDAAAPSSDAKADAKPAAKTETSSTPSTPSSSGSSSSGSSGTSGSGSGSSSGTGGGSSSTTASAV